MKKFLLYTGIGLLSAASVLFVLEQRAKADPTDNVSGYAWNSSIGLISMNCTNDNSCSTVSYGVTASPQGADYILSGYAWNDNIGWVSFNAADVSGCPVGSCIPTINTSTNFGAVTGYARILSLGAGAGYIQLSDTGTFPSPVVDGSGGTTYVNWTHTLVGSASSSDIGQIDFSDVGVAITPTVGAPSMDFSINNWHYVDNLSPLFIQPQIAYAAFGTTSYVKWDTANVTDCVATTNSGDPNWTGPIPSQTTPALGRSLLQNGPPISTKDYTITCKAISTGAPISKKLTLAYNSPASGASSNVTFTNTGLNSPVHVNWLPPANYTDCRVSTWVGPYPWNGPSEVAVTTIPAFSGGPIASNGMDLNPSADGTAKSVSLLFPGPIPQVPVTAYWVNLDCDDGTGARKIIQNAYRNINNPIPGLTVSLAADVSAAETGDPINLTYNATGADVCDAYSSPANTTWDNTFFSFTSGATNGVRPTTMGTATTTFYFACHGIDGTTQVATAVVTLIPAASTPPWVGIDAFPATGLIAPATTTLTYESTDTQSCTPTPASTPAGSVGWDGSTLTPNPTGTTGLTHDQLVSNINATTTFFIECVGTDGVTTATDGVQVIVDTTPLPAPIIRIMGDACIDVVPGPYTIFTTISGDVGSIDPNSCYAVDAANGNSPVGPVPWVIPANSSETSANTIQINTNPVGMSINVICETDDGDTISAASLVDLGEAIPLCIDDGTLERGPLRFYEH